MFAIMMIHLSTLKSLLHDNRGVTAVEYTVIAALIIGAVAASFRTLATDITSELTTVAGLL